jgi:hypothetical protein
VVTVRRRTTGLYSFGDDVKALKDIEFSEYSQNGEDGIIAHLVERLHTCTKQFVEIGSGSGKENNTTRLVKNDWSGVVFDRKLRRIDVYKRRGFEKVQAYCESVSTKNILDLSKRFPSEVDVFSIDIDSYDIHVAAKLLSDGFRPKIIVAEYNASFGEEPVAVPYGIELLKDLYFGAGVMAWVNLALSYGYEFVTVESSGTNSFFLKKTCGSWEFEGLAWTDSVYQSTRFGSWKSRARTLAGRPTQRFESC